MMKNDTISFFRRNLPHWIVADRAYFVTLRLHGTLPADVVSEMRRERAHAEAIGADDEQTATLRSAHFAIIDQILDSLKTATDGLCEPCVGEMVLRNMAWLQDRGWTIYIAVLLNTHVHMLMRNTIAGSEDMIKDLDSFKSFTGRRANRLLAQSGRFWSRDVFDRWVRNADEFDGYVRYIADNPVKAGLVKSWQDWRWTIVDDKVRYLLD